MSNPVVPFERIVLTGFMGSGKSTVGRLLANRLGWEFLDLDDSIAARCGMPIPEVFARFGEPHFRQQESMALADSLTRRNLVLALGGGAPETEASRKLLRATPNTAVIYLHGSFEILKARCVAQAAEPGAVARPVLADMEAARLRFARRTPLYEEMATHTLSTNVHSPAALAERLSTLLTFQP